MRYAANINEQQQLYPSPIHRSPRCCPCFFASCLCSPHTLPPTLLLRCSFVAKGGHLYEMDGRKETPVNHGPTSDETFAAVSPCMRWT